MAQDALKAEDLDAAKAHVAAARSHVDEASALVNGFGGDVWRWVPVGGGADPGRPAPRGRPRPGDLDRRDRHRGLPRADAERQPRAERPGRPRPARRHPHLAQPGRACTCTPRPTTSTPSRATPRSSARRCSRPATRRGPRSSRCARRTTRRRRCSTRCPTCSGPTASAPTSSRS